MPDGNCIRPGIPPDGCSEGFVHDGEYGCDPILPEDECAPGMMAVPGDVGCRPVMPCGTGTWGDLPVDATTQFVDGSYQDGSSDGTSGKPWTTINEAFSAAPSGGLIAIAAGSYPEQLKIQLKPIRIWGVCPEKVSIGGIGTGDTIAFGIGTDGSEVGGLSITAARFAVRVTGAVDVTLDRLWIHDTSDVGIMVHDELGRASTTIVSSLVEGARSVGVVALGSDLTLSASVIRSTLASLGDQMTGYGLQAQPNCLEGPCDPATRPRVTIEGSLFRGNRSYGVRIDGGDLTIKGTVARATLPRADNQEEGTGIQLQPACDTGSRCDIVMSSRAHIEGSLIDDNHAPGIFAWASDAEIVAPALSHLSLSPEETYARKTRDEAPSAGGPSGFDA